MSSNFKFSSPRNIERGDNFFMWPAVPSLNFGRSGVSILATWFKVEDTKTLLSEWEIFKASMGVNVGEEMAKLMRGSKYC